MSAEVTIALGVAGRVFANIACAQNPRLGAAFVGISNGFLLHRAWLAHTLLDPLTLLVVAAGLTFDHFLFGGFEGTVTLVLGCGLGVVLADFGPDLWYEVVGEQFTKELARELETFIPLGGYDSSSDVDDRSDVGSVVSKASSRHTSRSGMTGNSSVTVRPTVRPSRPRPTHTASASTITRLSRVTFDESSISASQSSDIGDFETDTGLSYGTGGPRGGVPTEFTRAGDGVSESADMYMEPSTTSGSTHTRVQMPPPSILRRLHIPQSDTMHVPQTASSRSESSRSRLTSDGEMTPRATSRPSEFSPSMPHPSFEPLGPTFPEPELSNGYEEYSPQIIPPSEPTPDISTSIHLPEPIYIPPIEHHTEYHEQDEQEHSPSRLMRILNVPIVDPHVPEEQNEFPESPRAPEEHNEYPESPESARLWVPPVHQPRSRSQSRSRSRSPPEVPQTQSPPKKESPPPPIIEDPPPPQYISESYDDSTVDVRDLDRDEAISRIEEAWKVVEKRRHRRLNILVRHDDDELQSRKNSNFHLMADLENLRFNMKVRPGIIIITSRSRR